MSEFPDKPWYDEGNIDREPESGGSGKNHFGFLRLYPERVTKSFTKGQYFTIPDVIGGNFDKQDENGLKIFKGWTQGGNKFLFVMVATKQNKEGDDYQIVKQYPSKLQKKGDPHLWGDIVFPSLEKLSQSERDKLSSEGLYCEWEEVGSGHMFKPEDKDEELEIKAWGNFKVYPDKATMKVAEDAFFDRVNSTTDNDTNSLYPEAWLITKSVDATIEWVKTDEEVKDMSHSEIARRLGLISGDGIVIAQTQRGEDVNVVALLANILNIPPAMVKL